MPSDDPTKLTLKQRAINEAKELTILTSYLFVVIAATNLQKAAVLHEYGIDSAYWGVAIVKAVLLAKFVALGRAFKVGEHKARDALIWPTLHKSFSFLVFLVCLTLVEEVVVGLIHHKSIALTLSELVGVRMAETLASVLILLLVLIPYFAFEVLAEALGERRLVRMFFVDRDALAARRSTSIES